MADQPMNLASPTGTIIVATLESLSGRALIIPGSARLEPVGGFDFDYEGSTEIDWDEQRTVTREDERVFIDQNGDEFLESELKLVRLEDEPRLPDRVITLTMEGGIVHSVEGIPHGVQVRVVDLDTEGAEPESVTTLPSGEKAYIRQWGKESEVLP